MAGGRFARGASLSILAAALFATASPASAERYLFDMLFGNRVPRERVAPRVERVAPPVRKAPARTATRRAAPRVSAPAVYDYRPEPLAAVNLAAISAALSSEGGLAASPFAKALASLSDFELLAEKKIAAAVVEHYSKHPAFVWVDGNGPNGRARQVMAVLGNAGDFGLSEADYVVTAPPTRGASTTNVQERGQALIRFELALTARALRYARDARLGRVDPNKLSGYHDFPAKPFDEATVLEVLSRTDKPADYLESLHPQNELYAALRQELKALRAESEQEIVVDPGIFVRPGGSHPDFAKLLRIIDRDADEQFRAEHGAVLMAHLGSDTYVPDLVPVIKAAQERHELKPDGVIGARTVGALAGQSKAARIEKVLLAMERLRWHPSHLGSTRVMINAASFTASFIEEGRERLSMRAVVGKPSTQTTFFYDEIEYVEFNPYWGVPQSIIVNEMLPRLRRDPGYLDRAGYEVINSSGRRISSSSVNWWSYGSRVHVGVRQPPGARNALGELKIMFPNKHDIYMHDTPEKSLFGRDTRAFSHGCVRLQDPRAMAAAVLGTTVEEIATTVEKRRNMRRDLPKKIPVYVGYFTAWPEPSGGISYHPDIYDRDASLEKALAKVEELRTQGS
ncbi:L,D-transpeptidase family protein [Chelativorans sp.]|uniref:L,D-transpeptidase family protein n=1 Tax=Chelativorans sp. TaxID=2203393 RepID=UPI00281154CB|nr:L,D-transpeptidase family protein [Chelativorans sp.]